MSERYDLYIGATVNVGESTGPDEDGLTGWIELGQGLETVRARLARALSLGRAAYVVPARYRTPAVTAEQARRLAEEVWSAEVERGRRLGPLEAAHDGLLWWEFVAADHELQARGVMPGILMVAIDKLDGSLRTSRAYDDWLRLSFPEFEATSEDD